MREVEFQETGMENFGPYIDPMILTFNPNMLVLMTGPNGIGKTMSLDSIPYTFYGITSKKAKGDDVVNNVVGKNCKTWVKFKVDSDSYIITRYHKYTKIGNTVILNKNGVDILKGHREVLPEIERLICSQKAFMNTLMFGQKVKDFFTDLVDSDKKEIFRKLLGLEQYLLYYKKTDEKLKEVKKIVDDLLTNLKIKQGLLTDTTDQIKYHELLEKKFYDDQKKDIESFKISLEDNQRLLDVGLKQQQDLEKKSFNIEEIINELTKINTELGTLEEKYESKLLELKTQSEHKKNELKLTASEAEKKISNETSEQNKIITNKIQILNDNLNEKILKTKDDNHKLSLEKNNLEADNLSNKQRIEEIKSTVLDKEISSCPTCEQEVDETTRKSLLDKVKNHLNTIGMNNKKIEIIKHKIKLYSENISSFEIEIKRQIFKLDEDCKTIAEHTKDKNEKISERINQAFKKVDDITIDQSNQLQEQAKQEKEDLLIRKENIVSLKDEAETHTKEVLDLKTIIENIKNKILVVKSSLENKENETYDSDQLLKYRQREIDLKSGITQIGNNLIENNNRSEILEFWKSSFSSSGIPSILLDESFPFMNKKISEYLELLTNGRYIVSFDALDETKAGEFRDKISVRVIDTHTRGNSRVQLSGGQTRIVDIATILTLGDLQSTINDVKFNILLFDEIFDALDYDNVGYVSKVLNKLKIGKSIFIISHQHQDQLEPDELLTLN